MLKTLKRKNVEMAAAIIAIGFRESMKVYVSQTARK